MSIFSFETGIGWYLIAFPLLVVESGRAAPVDGGLDGGATRA